MLFNMRPNNESNGRFHTDWLNMIYPRLRIARDLLTDDGVIFISMDDNEVHNLRKICDEVFGEENFVGTILWKKKTNGNNMGFLPPVHDYILCYSKIIGNLSEMGYDITNEFLKKTYSNPDNDLRGSWMTMDLSANHKGPYFPITNPLTDEKFLPPHGRYWVFNEVEVQRRIADGRIIFGKTGTTRPVQKVFASERRVGKIRAESWWDDKGMNEDATSEFKTMFESPKLFTHPKPSILILNLVQIAVQPGDIVLDFFSGSGTMAHAVMQHNADMLNGGGRKVKTSKIYHGADSRSL
ncbi:MAG: site-specific DNA-methyltransferase [Thermoguttaceae bacterium]|nr:site-specific DNA-methyltransferase [Thermoguttaceae bacterium]